MIHAIDSARNAEVWQGRIAGRLSNGSLEPAAIAATVGAADLRTTPYPLTPIPFLQSSD